MGKESKTESVHVHVQLIHFAMQQKLMPHCKSTILKKINLLKRPKKLK